LARESAYLPFWLAASSRPSCRCFDRPSCRQAFCRRSSAVVSLSDYTHQRTLFYLPFWLAALSRPACRCFDRLSCRRPSCRRSSAVVPFSLDEARPSFSHPTTLTSDPRLRAAVRGGAGGAAGGTGADQPTAAW